MPHSEINQTKKYPPLNSHTAAVYVALRNFLAPSCKLELARSSALLRIQDGAECGKNQSETLFKRYCPAYSLLGLLKVVIFERAPYYSLKYILQSVSYMIILCKVVAIISY